MFQYEKQLRRWIMQWQPITIPLPAIFKTREKADFTVFISSFSRPIFFNPFHVTSFILYPLKTSENWGSSNVLKVLNTHFIKLSFPREVFLTKGLFLKRSFPQSFHSLRKIRNKNKILELHVDFIWSFLLKCHWLPKIQHLSWKTGIIYKDAPHLFSFLSQCRSCEFFSGRLKKNKKRGKLGIFYDVQISRI